MEQDPTKWNTQVNTSGTTSLKTLARKVLERNSGWNIYGTRDLIPVPLLDQSVPVRGTNLQTNYSTQNEALSYAFEERAAIMEYDGGVSRKEAERQARVDLEGFK